MSAPEPVDRGISPAATFRVVVIALSVAVLVLFWPLWPALVLAVWTAALSRPLLLKFERGLKGRRRAAAALGLLLFFALCVPLGVSVLGVISGAQELRVQLEQSSSAKSALESIASGGDGPDLPSLPTDLPEVLALVQRYGAQSVNVLTNVAGAAASWMLALFIFFGGAYVVSVDGAEAWAWCKKHSPLHVRHLERLAAAFHETGRGLLVGVGLTCATQGLVATVVYAALGIPRWWVLGPITGLVSVVPLVGSALVWAPIVVGLFLTGHPMKASILAVVGVGVISTVDNVLRPIYARMGALKTPMFLLFVSIFGAMAVVGTWGALLGPLVVRLWMEAVEIRSEDAGAANSA